MPKVRNCGALRHPGALMGADACHALLKHYLPPFHLMYEQQVLRHALPLPPQKVLLMDEISTGLDSATTYTVTEFLRTTTHYLHLTTLVSLLQPPPEVYNLFDDVILLSDGCAAPCTPLKSVSWFVCKVCAICVQQSRSWLVLLPLSWRRPAVAEGRVSGAGGELLALFSCVMQILLQSAICICCWLRVSAGLLHFQRPLGPLLNQERDRLHDSDQRQSTRGLCCGSAGC